MVFLGLGPTMHATNIDQLGGVDQVFSMQMEHRLERSVGASLWL